MSGDIYLRDNPPTRSQYRSPRRKEPTGLTCIHTAESIMDTVGPDTGAENVAKFIQRRDTPGSYHDLGDSDSNIQLVDYGDEAYQDGTGSNPYAMSISFACRAADWPKMSTERREAFLRQGALAFARQQAWLTANGYPTTPLRRVTKAQSDKGEAGFISHADRDPGRRSDPGRDFPWNEWYLACLSATTHPNPAPPVIQEDDMPVLARGSSSKKYLTDLLTTKRWVRSAATVQKFKDAGIREVQADALDAVLAIVPDGEDIA